MIDLIGTFFKCICEYSRSPFVSPAGKKTINTITEFLMVLLVIMGLVLVLMETVGNGLCGFLVA